MTSLFRQEAIDHHAEDRRHGKLLQLTPTWTRWSYWLLVVVAVAGGAWALIGRVSEYATGPAIVRFDGRVEVTARFGATVAAVAVRPGERVDAGQELIRFHVDEESAELDRIREEFELQLIRVLRDPLDQAARQTLSSLRAQRELAAARVEQRLVRAEHAGIVSDVRIHAGQHLAVGDLILTIVPEDASASLIALLPGRYRPMLRQGMPLRFELSGYRYEYRDVSITSVGDEVVGPAEAKRFLGPEIADGVELREPVVLVRAALPSRTFRSAGRSFDYFDGLSAEAQARVRSEPVLLRAFPALRELFRHGS